VIKDNLNRKEKTMRTTQMDGQRPYLWASGDSDHEAAIVIEDIIKMQGDGVPLYDMAILYRSNTQVPPFEDQLRIGQVPYKIIGGQKFYEKKEIKDIIAYLTLIQNPRDELALRRILNVPNRGIGSVTLNKFLAKSGELKIPLFTVLKDEEDNDHIKEFVALIRKYQRVFNEQSLLVSIGQLLEEIHYNDFIEKSYDAAKLVSRKKEDVKNFLLSADRFQDRYGEDATLKNFVERLLLADAHDGNGTEDGMKKNEITLMTLHASKGLEFDNVYLIGMEEELLPHKKTILDNSDVNEERRLAYVGITRARKKLVMTYAKERKIYNKMAPRFKSRFIIELGDHFRELDRTNFGDMSEDEVVSFKKNFFGDLMSSLKE
jgi:DNA helicase II / ATP-dependent DNA helicase PcrA